MLTFKKRLLAGAASASAAFSRQADALYRVDGVATVVSSLITPQAPASAGQPAGQVGKYGAQRRRSILMLIRRRREPQRPNASRRGTMSASLRPASTQQAAISRGRHDGIPASPRFLFL